MVCEVETDDINENSDREESISIDSEEEVNDQESMDEEEGDSESDSNDPWDNLRVEVKEALNPSYDVAGCNNK